jgi:hypothetical protein
VKLRSIWARFLGSDPVAAAEKQAASEAGALEVATAERDRRRETLTAAELAFTEAEDAAAEDAAARLATARLMAERADRKVTTATKASEEAALALEVARREAAMRDAAKVADEAGEREELARALRAREVESALEALTRAGGALAKANKAAEERTAAEEQLSAARRALADVAAARAEELGRAADETRSELADHAATVRRAQPIATYAGKLSDAANACAEEVRRIVGEHGKAAAELGAEKPPEGLALAILEIGGFDPRPERIRCVEAGVDRLDQIFPDTRHRRWISLLGYGNGIGWGGSPPIRAEHVTNAEIVETMLRLPLAEARRAVSALDEERKGARQPDPAAERERMEHAAKHPPIVIAMGDLPPPGPVPRAPALDPLD